MQSEEEKRRRKYERGRRTAQKAKEEWEKKKKRFSLYFMFSPLKTIMNTQPQKYFGGAFKKKFYHDVF